MKIRFLTFLLSLFIYNGLFGQSARFRGQLTNYSSDYLLTMSLSNAKVEKDIPLSVSEDGSFEVDFKEDVMGPSKVFFSLAGKDRNRILYLNLYFSPGYDILLKATIDTANYKNTKKSVVLQGRGSYLSNLDLYELPSVDTVDWIKKDINTYIGYLNNLSELQYQKRLDSLLNRNPQDPYQQEWKTIFATDMKYRKLTVFISNYGFNNNISADTLATYFKSIGFGDLWNQINRDADLKSSFFRSLLSSLSFYEREGLIKFPNAVYEKFKNRPFMELHALDYLTKGEVRNYLLKHNIGKGILKTLDLDKVESLQQYISWVTNPSYQDKLNEIVKSRRQQLTDIKPGNSIAKEIKLLNSLTKDTVRLSDLKGKMVFIESWASWCGPCKQEIPHLKKLIEHYKDNPDIQFVSLGVFDDKAAQAKSRLQYIKDNQMHWLQLEDLDRIFSAYFKIDAIPHNVILDKDGRIVDNDSIRPSSPNIIKYLDELLEKN